jgi:hypothetical protein
MPFPIKISTFINPYQLYQLFGMAYSSTSLRIFQTRKMKRLPILLFILQVIAGQSQTLPTLPVFDEQLAQKPVADWLAKGCRTPAQIFKSADGRDLILYNGLLLRRFRIAPGPVCFDYKNLSSGEQLIRAVSPEARLIIDGKTCVIGGLSAQSERAYLMPGWIDRHTTQSNDFQLTAIETGPLRPFMNWKPKTWAGNLRQPGGQVLTLVFESKLPELAGLRVRIFYEIYDGLPLVVKWLSVENSGPEKRQLARVTSEILALVEGESAVGGSPDMMRKPQGIHVETDYSFGTDVQRPQISERATHWLTDPSYTSQVNYGYQTPCLLEIWPEKTGSLDLAAGATFRSVRTCELLLEGYDRERRGLAVRKMYRTLAPWTTQNPIFMHLISRDDQQVRDAVEQCVATGYEAIILSFGSHCNMEDTSAANLRRWRDLTGFAHARGILLGSYSLFSSRRISDTDDVIDPKTGKPGGAVFGNAPCFGSRWGLDYAEKLKIFMRETGFDLFENDGPYPGDVCASTTHPGHRNLDDSQWQQLNMQNDLYRWCNENGVYVNAPDWYFLNGSNKIALGYREVNFSLSREQQKILNRQNIYDGTWEKTPSMGWGFVPLTAYHGGGAEAVLEPLSEHLRDYEQLMVQYYGAGVQACYRGPRLFDTEETKQVVRKTIAWYKKYRDILNADIIHLRRPDGRDWDGILHVDPALPVKGFLLLYNPLKTPISRTIRVPLYYSGLETSAVFSNDSGSKKLKINRSYEAELPVEIPAEGWVWYEIR